MIVWIFSGICALFVARIVYLEVRCGRKNRAFFEKNDEQVASLKRQATERYRAKYGRDPTETMRTIPEPKVASKKA